jgi:hypothetical protein
MWHRRGLIPGGIEYVGIFVFAGFHSTLYGLTGPERFTPMTFTSLNRLCTSGNGTIAIRSYHERPNGRQVYRTGTAGDAHHSPEMAYVYFGGVEVIDANSGLDHAWMSAVISGPLYPDPSLQHSAAG